MKFIAFEKKIDTKKQYPAVYTRRSFQLKELPIRATLSMTALGVYVPFFNGQRISDELLLPGYTDYKHRVQANDFDVTDKISLGENVIAAIIGDGWYRGSVGIRSRRNCYGETLKLGCALKLVFPDGSENVIEADEIFRYTQDGPLRINDIKIGEFYDASKEMPGWASPGFDDAGWGNAFRSSFAGRVIPFENEKLITHETFTPTVIRTPDRNDVLDFGQNMSGFIGFSVTGKAGTAITLTMGETLDENGNFTQKNLMPAGSSFIGVKTGQKLTYVLREGRQSYRPIFLVSGFRYALPGNWPEQIKPENFTALAVYSDIPFSGTFQCSNEKINRFAENVIWSQKSNFVDIPTDCPTRERSGWTGDISVFCESACYLSDPRRFLKKWLNDYMSEQYHRAYDFRRLASLCFLHHRRHYIPDKISHNQRQTA